MSAGDKFPGRPLWTGRATALDGSAGPPPWMLRQGRYARLTAHWRLEGAVWAAGDEVIIRELAADKMLILGRL